MFLNTLSADGKCPIEDWENFALLIQMQLSGKRKPFLSFFFKFLEAILNFKHFKEKDDGHS